MGTKERKLREKELRRKNILSSAIQIIKENGFDCTTMDEIAAKSELSKGTLYLYFEDKLSLFRAIKADAYDRIKAKFLDIIQQDLSGLEMVIEMGQSIIEFIRSHPVHTQSLVLLGHPSEEENLIKRGRELTMLVTHAIQIGIQDGSIKKTINPKLMSIQVGWGFFGIILYYINKSYEIYDEILHENNTTIETLNKNYIISLLANKEAEQ